MLALRDVRLCDGKVGISYTSFFNDNIKLWIMHAAYIMSKYKLMSINRMFSAS